MASSTGVAISINEMLSIVSPDVLRYMIVRTRPERSINFDPAMGLLSLIDEYARIAEDKDSREYELSAISAIATDIPFRHMITVVQIAQDKETIFDILARSGYNVDNKEAVLAGAERARIWVETYAPDMVKFTVQTELPPAVFAYTEDDRNALRALLAHYVIMDEWKAETIHNAVYRVGEDTGVNAKKIFTAIYLAILGKERGPRAGWFLEALGKEFVVQRITDAVNAVA